MYRARYGWWEWEWMLHSWVLSISTYRKKFFFFFFIFLLLIQNLFIHLCTFIGIEFYRTNFFWFLMWGSFWAVWMEEELGGLWTEFNCLSSFWILSNWLAIFIKLCNICWTPKIHSNIMNSSNYQHAFHPTHKMHHQLLWHSSFL